MPDNEDTATVDTMPPAPITEHKWTDAERKQIESAMLRELQAMAAFAEFDAGEERLRQAKATQRQRVNAATSEKNSLLTVVARAHGINPDIPNAQEEWDVDLTRGAFVRKRGG